MTTDEFLPKGISGAHRPRDGAAAGGYRAGSGGGHLSLRTHGGALCKKVVCLDASGVMLEQGRRQAQKEGLSNMEFVFGICEALPFADGAFDAVFSRLAFHHFAEP